MDSFESATHHAIQLPFYHLVRFSKSATLPHGVPLTDQDSQCTNVSLQSNQQYNQQCHASHAIFISSSSIRLIHLFHCFCIAFVFSGLYLEGIVHCKINIPDSFAIYGNFHFELWNTEILIKVY